MQQTLVIQGKTFRCEPIGVVDPRTHTAPIEFVFHAECTEEMLSYLDCTHDRH